ncbi:hypothetical protein MLD38_034957 [Melastoma candidum]|uniref:Uncharacterized protein n=1 Tax=Melastoma candidum TaxID=119954 RepID=A0ACB9MBK2_9MYRT|nr:hypothetical protein MLD38_034957 [Melastoma candidum]
MAVSRFVRPLKRQYGMWAKLTAVGVLGLCFVVMWSLFSSSSSSVTYRRESFGDINEPVADGALRGSGSGSRGRGREFGGQSTEEEEAGKREDVGKEGKRERLEPPVDSLDVGSRAVNETQGLPGDDGHGTNKGGKENARGEGNGKRGEEVDNKRVSDGEEVEIGREKGGEENGKEGGEENGKEGGEEDGDEELILDGEGEGVDQEVESNEERERESDSGESADGENTGNEEKEASRPKGTINKGKKVKGPVFDPKAHYSWKMCTTRSKHNYIPCIDNEGGAGRLQIYRHSERSCPRTTPMCLVPLPHGGYETPVQWPDSKSKVVYKNVAHPKLAAYISRHSWVVESGEHLIFPSNQSEYKGGMLHYLEFIEEMVPDIEWGKNIRVVLDIGCTDSSLAASLLDKDVLILTLGLKDDLVDLAQIALERGFPTIVSPFGTRRLPFPSLVFDAIHCGKCGVQWHHNGGRLLLELNRILRPNGYFILSSKHETIEEEEEMSKLTASICWNILAHKTDEDSEVGVKVYQKPESNDIYGLRRRRNPPLCKEEENQDAAWNVPMEICLHPLPTAIEQHGTEWPEEWPKRLESFPEWLNAKERVVADSEHWKAVVNNSYLTGLDIDWSTIRNVMDMKAIYGGFAAALSPRQVWVMNVVPVNAPDTLPLIFERGLVGTYHDWCESFGTYPRSYDLLHADHLFSRLKNRCKQPVGIVVEMDRILRPGGWLIVRDKLEILNRLEGILKSMHWEIRLTYAQDKEGLLCAQKTLWRPR